MAFELNLSDRSAPAQEGPCPCPAQFTGVTVSTPATLAEWDTAARLVRDLFAWIGSSSDLDIACVQDSVIDELANLRETYGHRRGPFLVGRLGSEIVGTTAVLLHAPGLAELKRVWVAPHARGHHVSGALLHDALAAARQLGADRIRLETMPSVMRAAVRIYSAHGFQPIPAYSALSRRDDILAMARSL